MPASLSTIMQDISILPGHKQHGPMTAQQGFIMWRRAKTLSGSILRGGASQDEGETHFNLAIKFLLAFSACRGSEDEATRSMNKDIIT